MDIFKIALALAITIALMAVFFGYQAFNASNERWERIFALFLAAGCGLSAYALFFLSDPWIQAGMREEAVRWVAWLRQFA